MKYLNESFNNFINEKVAKINDMKLSLLTYSADLDEADLEDLLDELNWDYDEEDMEDEYDDYEEGLRSEVSDALKRSSNSIIKKVYNNFKDYLNESNIHETLSYNEEDTSKLPVNLTATAIQTSIGQHLIEFQITKVLNGSQFKKEKKQGSNSAEEFRSWFPVKYGVLVSRTESADKYAPAWNKDSSFTLKFKSVFDKYGIPLSDNTRSNSYFASDYDDSIPFEDWKELMQKNGFSTKKKGNKWISTQNFKNDDDALRWIKSPLK